MPLGLYVHIPFCRSRCIYCDFYSTTLGEDVRHRYIEALGREMRRRQTTTPLTTLYIGGGTPSTLSPDEMEALFVQLRQHFNTSSLQEVTVEANPDDITPTYCQRLKEWGVNRVSLGVQTFHDPLLRFLRRRHTAEAARAAVERLAAADIHNLSIDLIFGLPGQNITTWQNDLHEALSLPITHLSAYSLIYEAGTPLTRLRDRGEISEADEQLSLDMFQQLIDRTVEAGMEHYEISNFARPGYRSRHNASYWNGSPYIGLGPGAHSYDGGTRRRANAPDITDYIRALLAGDDAPHTEEHLTPGERCDELIFTALRTCEGLSIALLTEHCGEHAANALLTAARPHIAQQHLQYDGHHLRLTRDGLFISDSILSDLMVGEEG